MLLYVKIKKEETYLQVHTCTTVGIMELVFIQIYFLLLKIKIFFIEYLYYINIYIIYYIYISGIKAVHFGSFVYNLNKHLT